MSRHLLCPGMLVHTSDIVHLKAYHMLRICGIMVSETLFISILPRRAYYQTTSRHLIMLPEMAGVFDN